MNLEMALTDEMVDFACRLQPADCCLVPERREELTTEGGLDVAGQGDRIRGAAERLSAAGCRVSLFIDPDDRQIDSASRTGAKVIELHTGHFAGTTGTQQADALASLQSAAAHAAALGLSVNAGHGLHKDNLGSVARIPEVQELNIGHAIIARALFVGLRSAVEEVKQAMAAARAL